MKKHFGRHFAISCCLMVIAALLFVSSAIAQGTLGSINGTVLDGTGAAVPGSTVTVTDADINVTRTTKASSNGFFQVFNLPIGTYKVSATHDGFSTTELTGIDVKEAQATTLNMSLKVGAESTSVDVTANPMLNATDTTNGYTMDKEQIASTPLATGSFTQLAVLSPGTSAELLSNPDTNAGLGNQPIWANGERDTSNTFQVNGVDSTNLFNGKSSSASSSQRYNFNIGQGGAVGGETQTGISVYGSNGNSLPTPPTEFTQELRVNTSMYDAQQGATSGAQIDVNTSSGTNTIHGQVYGTFADNYANADPFFFKQQALLASQQGYGNFPMHLANPQLHRWSTGATVGGPLMKNKLYYFIGYQHLYVSDESTGLSQMTVPTGLTDDRSATGLANALTSWNKGTALPTIAISPISRDLLQAQLPGGGYLIPSAQGGSAAYAYNTPNVTLDGVSVLDGNLANGALDYDLTRNDRLSFKYYYQNDPLTKPFGYSQTAGFPTITANGAQVGEIDNTISIGPRLNWEQRLGYARERTYGYFKQTATDSADPAAGPNFGMTLGGGSALNASVLPGISVSKFALNSPTGVPSLSIGPNSQLVNQGYFQNRLNPSTNVIFTLGKHTLFAGGGYSYTQLNIRNNRPGLALVSPSTFETFYEGLASSGSYLDSSVNGKNTADRYYRSNEADAYVQDKWQAMSNLSITAGVRWDYHGGLTEKYGNIFNFDQNNYNVTGTQSGNNFDVIDAGFVVAPNNQNLTGVASGDIASSNSTLTGRQWGISPRIGFAFSPRRDNGTVVIRGGAGIYYDRGELFSYLSPPAGAGISGPFGVTQQSPLVSYVTAKSTKATFTNLFSNYSAPFTLPNSNPATQQAALQNVLTAWNSSTSADGPNCGAIGVQETSNCLSGLNFGAYDKNNVLPYTINFTLSMEWQPRNDIAITIGYSGNRGRHSVIPIPFNEPQNATAGNPPMYLGKGAHPSDQTTSYGYQVLTDTPCDSDGDFCSIGTEPYSFYDGGNTDIRVPYVGYSPFAAEFETVGNSAYDSLQTHLEKRLSHHVQAGVSYTWSHALDEQSDIGLFFTGNDPAHLKNSYASSDFDRTHVISANFLVSMPNLTQDRSFASYFTNDWTLTGIGVVQSGEPFSLEEFNGAVGSAQFGYYPSLINPVLPIKDPSNVRSALTGNSGAFRGTGGSYIPAIDPNQLAIVHLAPGQNGVPSGTSPGAKSTDPLDVYETDFSPVNQRNIFRQAYQDRLDLSLRKTFKAGRKIGIEYAFNVFNVFNHASFDVPQNSVGIRNHHACDTATNTSAYNCENSYLYGQIVTSQADQGATITSGPPGGGTAGENLEQTPYTGGSSGKATVLQPYIPVGVNGCTTSAEVTAAGCVNSARTFGSVTDMIGGNRAMTMGLHITY